MHTFKIGMRVNNAHIHTLVCESIMNSLLEFSEFLDAMQLALLEFSEWKIGVRVNNAHIHTLVCEHIIECVHY